MRLIFATQNKNKFKEAVEILSKKIEIISLSELSFTEEIPETHFTIKENAVERAEFIYKKFQTNCFADDSGLEIDALNCELGVFSARYAGKNSSDKDNINKVLRKMKNLANRKARFRTTVAIVIDKKTFSFEGVVEGEILQSPIGSKGFGYDPVFAPNGYNLSFAQMTSEKKNKISHRAIAMKKLSKFINAMI